EPASRQGDRETRRQGDKEKLCCCSQSSPHRHFFWSPCLLVSLSPCLFEAGQAFEEGTQHRRQTLAIARAARFADVHLVTRLQAQIGLLIVLENDVAQVDGKDLGSSALGDIGTDDVNIVRLRA